MLDLPALQNLLKRDPSSYIQEFQSQYRLFESKLPLIGASQDKHFASLVHFLSHAVPMYPKLPYYTEFPTSLLQLVKQQIHADVRLSVIHALILLRNKGLIPIDTYLFIISH